MPRCLFVNSIPSIEVRENLFHITLRSGDEDNELYIPLRLARKAALDALAVMEAFDSESRAPIPLRPVN